VLASNPIVTPVRRDLIDDFGKALSAADVHARNRGLRGGPSRRSRPDGRASAARCAAAATSSPFFVEKVEELATALKDVVRGRRC